MYKVGDKVVAVGDILEEGFRAEGEVWEHAKKDDAGEVVEVDAAGWPTVLWERTGTATLCDPLTEIRPLLTGGH